MLGQRSAEPHRLGDALRAGPPSLDRSSDLTGPGMPGTGQHGPMTVWEYLIIALPAFDSPTATPGVSASVAALNREGSQGWEAVGMTALADGTVAVLLKRPAGD